MFEGECVCVCVCVCVQVCAETVLYRTYTVLGFTINEGGGEERRLSIMSINTPWCLYAAGKGLAQSAEIRSESRKRAYSTRDFRL